MRITKKMYSDDFKNDAVKLGDSIGIPQAAKDLGINPANIRRWKQELLDDNVENNNLNEIEKEVRRLKKENQYLHQINDILKKSLGIFAKEKV